MLERLVSVERALRLHGFYGKYDGSVEEKYLIRTAAQRLPFLEALAA